MQNQKDYTVIYMAGIDVLYRFLFSSFEHIYYVFKYGEEKVIQDNDSCHIVWHLCYNFFVNCLLLEELYIT
jgi:hypothetical protein